MKQGLHTKANRKTGFFHRAATLMLTMLLIWQTTRTTAHAEGSTRSGHVTVYALDSASLMLRDADAENIDQLNYSFALIQDGRADGSHLVAAERVKAYLQRHPHIRGVLAVGGWGADGFSDACATAEGRQTLADSLLSLMDELNMTGLDIDWEYPGTSVGGLTSRPEDVENWYELLSLLRQGLDQRTAQTGKKHVLSVALGAGDALLQPIDPSRLNALVDQVVVMAYDLCGFDRTTGHHAALYPQNPEKQSGARAVQKLVAGGLSQDKLLLGLPAYGRAWRQVSSAADGYAVQAGISGTRIVTFDELMRLEENGYTHYYDPVAEAAYWYDGETFISGEDARSITAKGAWAMAQGLQGVAIWAYGQDATGEMFRLARQGVK